MGNGLSRKVEPKAARWWEIISHSPEETQQLGVVLGELASDGDLFLLAGNLGAGKTCLTQGIARGIGFSGYVASPTFVLMREYRGRLTMFHLDLYRLDSPREIEGLGVDEFMGQAGLCVVEWADKALEWFPEDHLLIKMNSGPQEEDRLLRLEPRGKRYFDLLERLEKRWNLP